MVSLVDFCLVCILIHHLNQWSQGNDPFHLVYGFFKYVSNKINFFVRILLSGHGCIAIRV